MTESLSPPAPRRLVHTRRLEIGCYKLADGTWDIEGQLVDVRPEPYDDLDQPRAANEPMHDLWLRLTIDGDGLVLKSEAAMPAGAYRHCRLVAPNYARLEGLSITKGWNKAVRERVGGTAGCTHLVEMLDAMATVAFQTLYPARKKKDEAGPPGRGGSLVDTCYALRSDGPVVKKEWPEFYTGD